MPDVNYDRKLRGSDEMIGRDADGEPIYAKGKRRADGVWQCPNGMAGTDLLAINVHNTSTRNGWLIRIGAS